VPHASLMRCCCMAIAAIAVASTWMVTPAEYRRLCCPSGRHWWADARSQSGATPFAG
jgi:hypothetical protein